MGHEHGSRLDDIESFMASLSDNATEAVKEVGRAVVDHSAHDHAHHDHITEDHGSHAQPVDHSAHAGHGGDVAGHHIMKMWFHGGYEEVILFDFWRIDSFTGLLMSCALIFVMGAMYEGLKWFRVYLQMNYQMLERVPHPREAGLRLNNIAQDQTPLNSGEKRCSNEDVYRPTTTPPSDIRAGRNSPFGVSHPLSLPRLVQAGMYVLQLILAYWLMLIVMTYNSWLTAAVILGAGFGHWLFAVLKIANPMGESADSFATDACH